ncbi:MAG: Elongation factor P [Chlamydiae bacterium]|nr:Elongation factor P [Chlamydiota bacterium]
MKSKAPLTSNQMTPGIMISLDKKIYRVESAVKVTVAKGTPFIKTKLKDMMTDELIEKNFKEGQEIQEVSLDERQLEFLYLEGKEYLFLDIGKLENILVSKNIIGDKVNFIKEGIIVKAMFYGDTIFSLELPQFLELMIVKTETDEGVAQIANTTKAAFLETGAKIDVPLFIETGDIVKVDTASSEFIQRV